MPRMKDMSDATKPAPPMDHADEHLLIDERRAAAGLSDPPSRANLSLRRALSLSGGGIRSATFSLGFLQAIAGRAPPSDKAGEIYVASRLSSFDYLSTVSGGGYIGAFLCSLFVPGRLRALPPGNREAPLPEGSDVPRAPRGQHADTPSQSSTPTVGERVRNMVGLGPDIKPAQAMPLGLQEEDGGERAAVRTAADDAVRVLASGPPGRIRSDQSYSGEERVKAPLAWLRENGRYLVPTGMGDAFYAGALGIRNWLALHYVIGTVLVALFAFVGLLQVLAAQLNVVRTYEVEALCYALSGHGTPTAGCPAVSGATDSAASLSMVWWSSLFPLAIVLVVLLGVPLGIAFWLVDERGDGTSRPLNKAIGWTFAVGLVMAAVGYYSWPGDLASQLMSWFRGTSSLEHTPQTRRLLVLLAVSALTFTGTLCYFVLAFFYRAASIQRVLLTRYLRDVFIVCLCIALLALVDTLGRSLYLAAVAGGGQSAPALTPAALAAALVWLAKRLAAKSPDKSAPPWLKKLPVFTLAGAAGIAIFMLVGGLWSMLIQWFVWGNEVPNATAQFNSTEQIITLCWIGAIAVFLGAVTGYFAGFINLSSLQPFYGSKLTRAYLGASNGKRYEEGSHALSAAEPLPGDDLSTDDYVVPAEGSRPPGALTLAPLHLINVTVNKTVDPAEQLVQRDRKGQPMAVLPHGFSIDRKWSSGFPQPTFLTAMQRPMRIGQWIGTSGAAFSTGIGRETSLGMSLLMGAANVRLGTWWQSGMGGAPFTLADAAMRSVGAVFRTQTYISYELRARFFGTRRRWQYLSDGGHFENTGLYELLRKGRRVYQVFGCDNGADPNYRFEDLANLIRLARIDLNVEVTVQTKFDAPLDQVFAAPSDFRRVGKRPAPVMPSARPSEDRPDLWVGNAGAAANESASSKTPVALMLWATYLGDDAPSTQIVLIKPNVPYDAGADIQQYASEHTAFPQEPTADQFFDEAQWESYRALGEHIGRKVFDPRMLDAIEALARARLRFDRPKDAATQGGEGTPAVERAVGT